MLVDFDMLEEAKKKAKADSEELNKRCEEIRISELKKKGIDPHKYDNEYNHHGDCDSVYSMENSEATILWIIVMAVGALFVDRWLIWILATFIWRKFMTRHK